MFGGKMEKKRQEIENLARVQRTQIDGDYSCGIFNGLELALAVLEEREPIFAVYTDPNTELKEIPEKKVGRTAYGGKVRKRTC